MGWHATLELAYEVSQGKTGVHFQHQGPLRVLKSLYPEGDKVCHNVLVHPPGGLVGGDTLEINIHVKTQAHALVTTPGATRFYRSLGEPATQAVHAQLEEGARLEWLPLEALAYDQCQAQNRAIFDLASGAELMGWDITALGLPMAQLPFERGTFSQHIEVPGVWLEQGRIDATDLRLMNGPLGLAGHRCMATLFFVSGRTITRDRRERALDAVRTLMDAHPLRMTAGATAPNPQVLVVRVLSPLVEPAMDLLKTMRACWRESLWDMQTSNPRVWRT
jgi:urease accessory protein